jgi:hypothetical protein
VVRQKRTSEMATALADIDPRPPQSKARSVLATIRNDFCVSASLMHHERRCIMREDQQQFVCSRCGEKAGFVLKLLDSRKGRDVRLYQCRCGALIWDDEAQGSGGDQN